jgi:hypothetical protein
MKTDIHDKVKILTNILLYSNIIIVEIRNCNINFPTVAIVSKMQIVLISGIKPWFSLAGF